MVVAIRVWEVEMGHEVAKLVVHTDAALSVALNVDGSRIVSGSAD